jgi:Xaa-Pro dipeptidase
MQYSPNNDIMYVSMVDAGTVEFLRGLGKQIVSSADLVSQFEAVLTRSRSPRTPLPRWPSTAFWPRAWREMGRRCALTRAGVGTLTEFDMVQWLSEAMRRENLVWENGPNVSANANSSDSHYEPTADRSSPIREDDFMLIDIWGRVDRPPASTTTSPGPAWWAASPATASSLSSRPCATPATPPSPPSSRPLPRPAHPRLRGRRCRPRRHPRGRLRRVLYPPHRPQHRHEIHGPGAHLDNLETHDERRILPHTCFSVEPGIYLPEFGVRSEIDMLTAPGKAWVTGKDATRTSSESRVVSQNSLSKSKPSSRAKGGFSVWGWRVEGTAGCSFMPAS